MDRNHLRDQQGRLSKIPPTAEYFAITNQPGYKIRFKTMGKCLSYKRKAQDIIVIRTSSQFFGGYMFALKRTEGYP